LEGSLVDYWDLLSVEQQQAISGLQRIADRRELSVVNEYLRNGHLRSHSVGLTSFDLPEVLIYGLAVEDAGSFFDALFESFREPDRTIPIPFLMAGAVSQKIAARLVPILQCIFPDGFQLAQIVWPDGNGAYPTQRGFDKRLEARQPRAWAREALNERLLPRPNSTGVTSPGG
jgi:hypothetical protein